MMIGPEPITRTRLDVLALRQSGLRRRSACRHQLAEPVEEVRRVVRAGRRLGVVLHREALQRRRPASRSSRPSTTSSLRQTWLTVATPYGVSVGAVERRVDGEPVVVRGDLDLAGGAVHHRLVDAAVAVLQLVGAEAERPAEELVAEADPEVGQPALERALAAARPGRWSPPGRRGRWRRTARRAATASTSSSVDGRGQHVHLDAALGHHPRGVRLDAEVDGGDGEPLLPDRRDDVGLGRWRPRRPARRRPSRAASRTRASSASASVSVEEMPTRIAPRSRRWRVSARVSMPRDADHALLAQLVVEGAPRAPVGRRPGRGRARRTRRPRSCATPGPRR